MLFAFSQGSDEFLLVTWKAVASTRLFVSAVVDSDKAEKTNERVAGGKATPRQTFHFDITAEAVISSSAFMGLSANKPIE